MQQKHDVIALISGGKDSFLSLLYCLAQNHRIIALANLYPLAPDSASDLNSYMYQTVGHTLVPLYATALNIPLYRGEISGSAGTANRDYHPNVLSLSPPSSEKSSSNIGIFQKQLLIGEESKKETFDETESLLPLLRLIIATHPTASALSSGAILSTYQRTRIESVALRLNLTPIAYLWQYPVLPCPLPSQSSLLQQVAAVGLEARIVKVASGGLHEGHLWADLRDEEWRKKVEKGVSRFGGNVLGEGGEYETIVMDGPIELFKGRIEVGEGERWIGRGEGGEAWLGFSGGKTTDKENKNDGEGFMERLRVPELWDEGFGELVRRINREENVFLNPAETFQRKPNQDDWIAKLVITKSASTIAICNVLAPLHLSNGVSQMSAIVDCLHSLLATHNLLPSSIIFTSLFLRSMSDFSSINTVYSTLFSEPNPPARVTVGCGDALPEGVNVMANFVMNAWEEIRKQGLHVQSRSYWAPANIGAYSQAIALGVREVSGESGEMDSEEGEKVALVYVAGQIPLVPATMEVLSEEGEDRKGAVAGGMRFQSYGLGLFFKQACLALQHLWRIGKAMDVGWWTGGIAFIVGEKDDVQKKADAAWLAWKMVHQRDFGGTEGVLEEDVDIWDQKHGGGVSSFAVSDREACLPNFEKVQLDSGVALNEDYVPGFFAVQVDELPRGCKIEWQALGVKNGVVRVGVLAEEDIQLYSCSLQACGNIISYFGISMPSLDQSLETSILKAIDKAKSMVQVGRGEKAQAFSVQVTIYTPYMSLVGGLDAQIVPCRAVWGPAVAELAAGIVLHSERRC